MAIVNTVPSLRFAVPAVLACFGLALHTGCSALMLGGREKTSLSGIDTKAMQAEGYSFGPMGAQMPSPRSASYPGVVLEVLNGKQHLERIPLTPDKPVLIEDIIRDAKLVEKLGPIQVAILRPTSPNRPPVRMEIEFDDRGERVMAAKNYTLHPGDQIVVVPIVRQWSTNLLTSFIPFANNKR